MQSWFITFYIVCFITLFWFMEKYEGPKTWKLKIFVGPHSESRQYNLLVFLLQRSKILGRAFGLTVKTQTEKPVFCISLESSLLMQTWWGSMVAHASESLPSTWETWLGFRISPSLAASGIWKVSLQMGVCLFYFTLFISWISIKHSFKKKKLKRIRCYTF